MEGLRLVPIEYNDQQVLKYQALFLYDLLKERDPVANISHKKMPAFYQHLTFINSRPYAVWNIIETDNGPIGAIYLTKQDEIGLFISKSMQGCRLGRHALKMFMEQNPRPKYLANISPENIRSQSFFNRMGFKHIQQTYVLEPECVV